MTKAQDRKIVYICASNANKQAIELQSIYTEALLRMGCTPIASPVMYAACTCDTAADNAMLRAAGISLLHRCDEVWVFGNTITAQQAAEIRTAQSLDIPVRIAKLYSRLAGIRLCQLPSALLEVRTLGV